MTRPNIPIMPFPMGPEFYTIVRAEEDPDGKLKPYEPGTYYRRTRVTLFDPYEIAWTNDIFDATRFASRDSAQRELHRIQPLVQFPLHESEVF
jgi:hypothetical protein